MTRELERHTTEQNPIVLNHSIGIAMDDKHYYDNYRCWWRYLYHIVQGGVDILL